MSREGRGGSADGPAGVTFAVAKAFPLVKHPRRPKAASGELNANARWTWAIARAIRAAHAKGESNVEIARRFGVNRGTVFKIVNNQQWTEMSTTPTADLAALLREFYTAEEAFVWLTSPQPQFDGAVALDMIAAGRTGELVRSLRRMQEGVYL